MRPFATATVAGLLAMLCLMPLPAAATDAIQTGWAAWFNSVKLSERWKLTSDVQVRSSDEWEQVRALVGRAALNYSLTPWLSAGAGYAGVAVYQSGLPTRIENRPFEQLIAEQKIAGLPVTHRLRLEQRFLERRDGRHVYSDRLRYFARMQIPFAASAGGPFTHGGYAALQNELFLNLTGEDKLNGKTFDQNRAYAGLGYRFSPKLDLELGYMNQFIAERNNDLVNHIVQLSLYTRM